MRLEKPEDLIEALDKGICELYGSIMTLEDFGFMEKEVAEKLYKKVNRLLALERSLDEELEKLDVYRSSSKD